MRAFWRRDRDSNSGVAVTRRRISNPLHYHSATSPKGAQKYICCVQSAKEYS